MLGLPDDQAHVRPRLLSFLTRARRLGAWSFPIPSSYSRHLKRILLSVLFFGLIYFLLQSTFRPIASQYAATTRSPERNPSRISNTGWVTFDDRLDLPYVKRYTKTAPPTRLELQFSEACRDLWISKAVLCPRLQQAWNHPGPLSNQHTFDVVYTWQNGSDPIQTKAREAAAKDTSSGRTGTGAHHYRDHDELKYSLRSLLKAISCYPDVVEKIFLYTSDFPSEKPHQRIGSIPKWLNVHHPNHLSSKMELVFPWQTFKTPAAASVQEALDWRANALPTFQSMAVESQFANIGFNEYMLYSCDDFFLFNTLSPSDAYTPLFGPNLRLRTSHQTYKPVDPKVYTGARIHERLSLTNAAFVLGKRFGNRNHRYIEHINKIYNKPLLEEVQSCFAEELKEAANVRLRGRGPDLNIHSLFIHYVIERHREALLWSVIVAKADSDHNGFYGSAEYTELLRSLGKIKRGRISVQQPRRTIDTSSLLKQAGLEQPLQTTFDFTSMNGYALSLPRGKKEGVAPFPDFSRPGSKIFCHISLERCFGSNSTMAPTNSTSDIFKHIAFEDPQCGDCIIVALLGEDLKGLESFLPAKSRAPGNNLNTSDSLDTPVLPLTKTWQETDLALASVLPPDLCARDFVTRLLLRYSYTMGGQKSRLIRLHNELEGRWELGRVKPEHAFLSLGSLIFPKNPSFLGINDDIEEDEGKINSMLHGWFNMHWPVPLQWELEYGG